MFHSVWTKRLVSPLMKMVKTHHKYLLDVILLHSHSLVLTRTEGTHRVDLTVGGGREEKGEKGEGRRGRK